MKNKFTIIFVGLVILNGCSEKMTQSSSTSVLGKGSSGSGAKPVYEGTTGVNDFATLGMRMANALDVTLAMNPLQNTYNNALVRMNDNNLPNKLGHSQVLGAQQVELAACVTAVNQNPQRIGTNINANAGIGTITDVQWRAYFTELSRRLLAESTLNPAHEAAAFELLTGLKAIGGMTTREAMHHTCAAFAWSLQANTL